MTMKLYTPLLIIIMILISSCSTNPDKNFTIYSNEDNIQFFEIDDSKLTQEFLQSTQFRDKLYENIDKNLELNLNSENTITINTEVDNIKYIPYQVYLSDDNKVERISSYYGITDKSDNKIDGNFYTEDFTTENEETHFVNSINYKISLSSHYPNVKVYFAKVDNKYLVFSLKR